MGGSASSISLRGHAVLYRLSFSERVPPAVDLHRRGSRHRLSPVGSTVAERVRVVRDDAALHPQTGGISHLPVPKAVYLSVRHPSRLALHGAAGPGAGRGA